MTCYRPNLKPHYCQLRVVQTTFTLLTKPDLVYWQICRPKPMQTSWRRHCHTPLRPLRHTQTHYFRAQLATHRRAQCLCCACAWHSANCGLCTKTPAGGFAECTFAGAMCWKCVGKENDVMHSCTKLVVTHVLELRQLCIMCAYVYSCTWTALGKKNTHTHMRSARFGWHARMPCMSQTQTDAWNFALGDGGG